MNYVFDFEGFIYKNPKLKLSKFLKKEKIPLTEIKQGPAVYIIFCKLKQKVYLGQSGNIYRRLGDHWHTLNNNCHDCIELQKDWNALGSEGFVFACLCVGSKWEDEKKRKKLENDLVEKNNFFYNVGLIKKQEGKYKKAIKYKSIFYSSISEASIHLNIAETSIRRKLKDPNEKEFEYVDSSKWNPQYI
jgi:GIY-YIG catalytic domain